MARNSRGFVPGRGTAALYCGWLLLLAHPACALLAGPLCVAAAPEQPPEIQDPAWSALHDAIRSSRWGDARRAVAAVYVDVAAVLDLLHTQDDRVRRPGRAPHTHSATARTGSHAARAPGGAAGRRPARAANSPPTPPPPPCGHAQGFTALNLLACAGRADVLTELLNLLARVTGPSTDEVRS